MRLLRCLIVLAIITAGCARPRPGAVPPSPAPPEPSPVKEEAPSPPRKLSPQVGREEENQLKQEVETKIKGAERLVKQIDEKALALDQQELLSTARNFLSKAKEALSTKDFVRALNLADKAQVLAEDLSRTLR